MVRTFIFNPLESNPTGSRIPDGSVVRTFSAVTAKGQSSILLGQGSKIPHAGGTVVVVAVLLLVGSLGSHRAVRSIQKQPVT